MGLFRKLLPVSRKLISKLVLVLDFGLAVLAQV